MNKQTHEEAVEQLKAYFSQYKTHPKIVKRYISLLEKDFTAEQVIKGHKMLFIIGQSFQELPKSQDDFSYASED